MSQRRIGARKLELGMLTVHNFERAKDEDTWFGTAYLFGFPHHFQAIKVREEAGVLVATRDPHGRFDDLHEIYAERPVTSRLPGLDGEFVIVIYPHAD
jgi:hypothetical protein